MICGMKNNENYLKNITVMTSHGDGGTKLLI